MKKLIISTVMMLGISLYTIAQHENIFVADGLKVTESGIIENDKLTKGKVSAVRLHYIIKKYLVTQLRDELKIKVSKEDLDSKVKQLMKEIHGVEILTQKQIDLFNNSIKLQVKLLEGLKESSQKADQIYESNIEYKRIWNKTTWKAMKSFYKSESSIEKSITLWNNSMLTLEREYESKQFFALEELVFEAYIKMNAELSLEDLNQKLDNWVVETMKSTYLRGDFCGVNIKGSLTHTLNRLYNNKKAYRQLEKLPDSK